MNDAMVRWLYAMWVSSIWYESSLMNGKKRLYAKTRGIVMFDRIVTGRESLEG